MNSTLDQLDALAKQIADAAIKDEVPLAEKQDAFKLLFPYYALRFKARAREGDGETEALTFGDMASAFSEGANDSGDVQDRRGTRAFPNGGGDPGET